ncbi:MAG TPA: hypothetical protein VI756_24990 [Blastocatellia bacterium]
MGKIIATLLAGGFRQATNPASITKNQQGGATMSKDQEYLVEAGVIYTDLEIEEIEEVIAPVTVLGN